MRDYYDAAYFEWQKSSGAFAATVDLFKFEAYINPNDSLIDFGCGGGFLLNRIACERKAGIEPNEAARAHAEQLGLRVYKEVEEAPDEFATIVISNHALEHVEAPLDSIRRLVPKMQPGAKAVFVVPHESECKTYDPTDVNQHLYTWTSQTLGNLFAAAGFTNIAVRSIRHMWPPFHSHIHAALGLKAFHIVCRAYALMRANYQLCVIAERPQNAIQDKP
jgi:hypothetical protein